MDGGNNCINKAAFSNFSRVMWELTCLTDVIGFKKFIHFKL